MRSFKTVFVVIIAICCCTSIQFVAGATKETKDKNKPTKGKTDVEAAAAVIEGLDAEADLKAVQKTDTEIKDLRKVLGEIVMKTKAHAEDIFLNTLKEELQTQGKELMEESANEVKNSVLKYIDVKQLESVVNTADQKLQKVEDSLRTIVEKANCKTQSVLDKSERLEKKAMDKLYSGEELLNEKDRDDYKRLVRETEESMEKIKTFMTELTSISTNKASGLLEKTSGIRKETKENIIKEAKKLVNELSEVKTLEDLKKMFKETDNDLITSGKALVRIIQRCSKEADALDKKGGEKAKHMGKAVLKELVERAKKGISKGFKKAMRALTGHGIRAIAQSMEKSKLKQEAETAKGKRSQVGDISEDPSKVVDEEEEEEEDQEVAEAKAGATKDEEVKLGTTKKEVLNLDAETVDAKNEIAQTKVGTAKEVAEINEGATKKEALKVARETVGAQKMDSTAAGGVRPTTPTATATDLTML